MLKKFVFVVALALLLATITGCSTEEDIDTDITDEPEARLGEMMEENNVDAMMLSYFVMSLLKTVYELIESTNSSGMSLMS